MDIKINKIQNLTITSEEIADLLVTAFEGGINYWCNEVIMSDEASNIEGVKYASDVIGLGGTLTIVEDEDGGVKHELNLEKMIKGIVRGMEWADVTTIEDLMDGHDAETADVILQYALFDEIVYG